MRLDKSQPHIWDNKESPVFCVLTSGSRQKVLLATERKNRAVLDILKFWSVFIFKGQLQLETTKSPEYYNKELQTTVLLFFVRMFKKYFQRNKLPDGDLMAI